VKLYYFETMNPRKVCALAKHVGSPVSYERVDLREGAHKRAEHLARDPNGRVPVLEDGARTLTESAAIMMYLASKAGSPLWPGTEDARAEVLRFLSWDAVHFAPRVGTFYFERYIKPQLFGRPGDEEKVAGATESFHASAAVLDQHLAGRAFVTGDALTIADFALGAMLPEAERIGLPLEPYAHVRAWYERLAALPAWRDPWPSASA
jgi:glutathione S-transferase